MRGFLFAPAAAAALERQIDYLAVEMVRGWEDKTLTPDPAAVTLLRMILADPDAVRRVVAAE